MRSDQYQEKIQQPIDNTKKSTKTSITQRLRTTLGWLIGKTAAIQLVLLNRCTGTQHFDQPQKLCYQRNTHLKIQRHRMIHRIRRLIQPYLQMNGHTLFHFQGLG